MMVLGIKSNYLLVSTVLKTYHLLGGLRVKWWNGFDPSFLKKEQLFLFRMGSYVPYQIEKHRWLERGKSSTLKLKGVNGFSRAKELVGYDFFVTPEQLIAPPLEEEKKVTFFLLGYRVIDDKGGFLGKVIGLEPKRYYSLLLFRSLKEGEELPLSPNAISKIDHKKREIKVSLPEGYESAFF